MKKLMSLFVISSFVFAMPVLADPSGQQDQRPGGSGPNGQQGQGPNGPPPGCPARNSVPPPGAPKPPANCPQPGSAPPPR